MQALPVVGSHGNRAAWPATRLLLAALLLAPLAALHAAEAHKPKATEVFDHRQPVIFQEDFHAGFGKFKLAIDGTEDRAALDQQAQEKRVQIVPAPDSEKGHMAVRCVVPRALGSYRSEVSLIHEEGFHERWYGARIYVPKDWVFEESGSDIVLQWHGLIANEKQGGGGHPPLSIVIKNNHWDLRRHYGEVNNPKADHKELDEPVQKGKWIAWVIHIRWNSGAEGWVQIWKDGKLVWDVKGPNTYLSRPVVPYFKTGLYHPEWKKKNEDKFKQEVTTLTGRIIYTADVKIGDERAKFDDVAPKP